MLQLNGTAIPSLALENLQELEDQPLSGCGSDREEAEDIIWDLDQALSHAGRA